MTDLQRRSFPDSLRYLAAKLRDGQENVSPVALALEVLADETETTAADPTTETEGFRAWQAGHAAGRAEGAAAERQRIGLAVQQTCACGSCKRFIADLLREDMP